MVANLTVSRISLLLFNGIIVAEFKRTYKSFSFFKNISFFSVEGLQFGRKSGDTRFVLLHCDLHVLYCDCAHLGKNMGEVQDF